MIGFVNTGGGTTLSNFDHLWCAALPVFSAVSFVKDASAKFAVASPFIAKVECFVESTPHDAGLGDFGIADLAGLVDVLVGEAEVRDAGNCFRSRSNWTRLRFDLPPLLRGLAAVWSPRGSILNAGLCQPAPAARRDVRGLVVGLQGCRP